MSNILEQYPNVPYFQSHFLFGSSGHGVSASQYTLYSGKVYYNVIMFMLCHNIHLKWNLNNIAFILNRNGLYFAEAIYAESDNWLNNASTQFHKDLEENCRI